MGEAQGKNQVLLYKPLIKGHVERSPVLPAGSVENPVLFLFSLLDWAPVTAALGSLIQETV